MRFGLAPARTGYADPVIGFPRRLIEEFVLESQADPAVPEERRTYLDPEARPIDVSPQEADVLGLTTRPTSYEIGGGLELRHVVSVAVDVQHGDGAEAVRRRDLIVTDLVLRALDNRDEILAATDELSGQYVTRLDFEIDYRPLGSRTTADTPNESAVIAFTLDCTLDR